MRFPLNQNFRTSGHAMTTQQSNPGLILSTSALTQLPASALYVQQRACPPTHHQHKKPLGMCSAASRCACWPATSSGSSSSVCECVLEKNHLKQVLVPVLPAPYCLSITMTHTKARRRRGELVVNNWEGMQSNAVHTLSCTASTQQFETAIKIEFSSQSEAMPHSSQHTARYMHPTQTAPGSCATT